MGLMKREKKKNGNGCRTHISLSGLCGVYPVSLGGSGVPAPLLV